MTRRTITALVSLTLVASLMSFAGPASAQEASVRALPQPSPTGKAPRPRFDPDTVLVKFRGGTTASDRRSTLARHGTEERETVRGTGYVLTGTRGRSPRDAAADLRGDPSVEDVELNYIRTASATPNDPFFVQKYQEYLKKVRLPAAWNVTKGKTASLIAIIDTGIRSHPDLGSRIKPGYNAITGTTNATDDNGHGTAVAATAAAITNNGAGMAGAAWNAGLQPVKVLAADGQGTDADVAEGITWAADHGAKVLNLSLGGSGTSAVLQNAVNYALGKGKVIVAAAGNNGWNYPHYPAAYEGVIAVSATDTNSNFVWWSNYGDWVDVSAPGLDITAPCKPPIGNQYCAWSGTSFSAPIVSGIALLTRVKYPNYTPTNVLNRLRNRSRGYGPPGFDPFYGAGRVDAYAALGGPVAAPVAPAAGDVLEPNNTVATAEGLTYGNPSISPEGDVDWFFLDVPISTGTFSVRVLPSSMDTTYPYRSFEMDPVIAVYAADGTTLLGSADLTGTGQEEYLSIPLGGSPQRYYAAVWNFHGSRSSGSYQIYLEAALG